MELLPAIDIRFGRVVRLTRRDASAVTPFDEDPVALAERFAMQGARWLHLVDLDRVKQVRDLEVARIVLGSVATTQPDILPQALKLLGAPRVAVGIDARNGLAVLRGWQESSTTFARDIAANVAREGVRTVIYTDVGREGMLQGMDLVGAVEMQETSGAGVIASGGVSSLDDLIRAKASVLAGVIVGRALYEGRFTLPEALTALLDA